METLLWLLPYFLISIEISFLAGTVGAYIYTRKIAGIVGGLSHFSLGPIGVSYIISYLLGYTLNISLVSMFFMIMVALLLPIDNKGNIKTDSEIQVLWSMGMAIGLLVMFLLPNYFNLDIFLFGSLLTMSSFHIIWLSVVTVLVLSIEFVFHNRFKYLGVDDEFIKVRRINPNIYHRLQLIIIVITISLLLESIGILMMIAVLTIPTAIATMLTQKHRNVIVMSILFAMLGMCLGISMSYIFDLQISSIVTLIMGLSYIVIRIYSRRKMRM